MTARDVIDDHVRRVLRGEKDKLCECACKGVDHRPGGLGCLVCECPFFLPRPSSKEERE